MRPNAQVTAVDLATRLAEQEQKFEDLTHVAWSITSLLDLEQVLATLMEVALRMVGAEVGGIFMQDDGRPRAEISWGLDAEIVASIRVGQDDLISAVYATGEPIGLEDRTVMLAGASRRIYVKALLAVPIVAHSRVFGVLVLVNPTAGDVFTPDELQTARMLVGFAAVAIQNAGLLHEKLQRQKIQQQLAVAKSVQTTLLPAADMKFPGLEWQALYVPAFDVGGDYYDLIRISEDEAALVVGDVSSKGIPAALMMTAVRSVVRSEASHRDQTGAIVSRVNRILCADFTRNQDMYVTLFYAYINWAQRRLVYTNAGHLPPVLWYPGDSAFLRLNVGGIILGQFDDFHFQQAELKLKEGWRMLGYTDGITETESPSGELFGIQRTLDFILAHRDAAAGEFLSGMRAELDCFAKENTERDDLTLVWVGGRS
jgi:serine phosphatase RsbU (regulator of sigma subunit)